MTGRKGGRTHFGTAASTSRGQGNPLRTGGGVVYGTRGRPGVQDRPTLKEIRGRGKTSSSSPPTQKN